MPPRSDGAFECQAWLSATFDDRADVLVVVERSPGGLLVVLFVSARAGCEPPALPEEYAAYFTAPAQQGGVQRDPHDILLVGVGDATCVDALRDELRPAPAREPVACLAASSVDFSDCVVLDQARAGSPAQWVPACDDDESRRPCWRAGEDPDCPSPSHSITVERAPGVRNYDFYVACACR